MKRLLIVGMMFLAGCVATIGQDARQIVMRGRAAIVAADAKDDYPAYYKAIEEMARDYRSVMGESAAIDLLANRLVELGQVEEKRAMAPARGEELGPYDNEINFLLGRIKIASESVNREIELAQQNADRIAEKRADTFSTLGAVIVGVMGGIIGARLANPPAAPTYQAPTTCTTSEVGGTRRAMGTLVTNCF